MKFSLKHRMLTLSLRSRLILYFIVAFILPFMIVMAVSYSIVYNINKQTAIQYSTQMIEQTSGKIDDFLLEAYKIGNMIAEDPSIQEPLRRPLDEDIAKQYSTDLTIDSKLNFTASSRNNFFGFYVVGANGAKYKSNYCSVRSGDLRETDWYKQIVESAKPVWFSTHVDSFAVETIGQSFVTVGLPIIDKASGKIAGVALVDVEERVVFNNIMVSKLGKTGFMFIEDSNKKVVSSSNDQITAENLPKIDLSDKDKIIYNWSPVKNKTGDRYIYSGRISPLTGWKFIGLIPTSELSKDSIVVGRIMIFMLIIICILGFVAVWEIAGSVANPVRKLIGLMKMAEEGDLSVEMNVRYNDEIGQLGKSFNIMIKKISNLMDKVYEEQKKLRKAELKALQAQINPHFLYNTLDSVIWMSRAKNNEDVIEMVTALAKLFRIGLSRGKDLISIKEEVEHVNSYLTIQHIRYRNKFSYEVIVPEELHEYKTVKLILQPIVENAIYHGVKNKREKGHISVTGRDCGEFIIFEVSDNGLGMNDEQLKLLKDMLENINSNKIKSLGVKNVSERIKMLFGCDFGLTFYSEYNKGTMVEIKIPKVLEVEDNAKGNVG